MSQGLMRFSRYKFLFQNILSLLFPLIKIITKALQSIAALRLNFMLVGGGRIW
jgi:hypothetical protein